MKFKLCMFLVLLSLSFSGRATGADGNFYTRVELKGSVNPVTADYITAAISKANAEGTSFILLTIDTPGGLMTSLREIVQSIMSSSVPVVVYTYPKGAQAASAGGFIMLSGHVNAMAPGTEIGAMHPVAPGLKFYEDKPGDGDDEVENLPDEKNVMGMKVLNDTRAFGRSLAQKHDRNQEWVENAIEEAGSSSYAEAHEAGVVDIIADDIDDLLIKLNGRSVSVDGEEYIFDTEHIQERAELMSSKQSFFNFFADPQILMLLLVLAIGGIALEFKNPGMIIPGALGGIAFILFLMTVQIIPVNVIGVVLIIAGFALFVLELFITSYGLLTLAGLGSFIGGSLMLFDNPIQGFSVSPVTIGAMSLMVLVLVFVIIRAVVRTHSQEESTGTSILLGKEALVKQSIAAGTPGKVFLHGELWNALADEEIVEGERVKVTQVNGMTLHVTRLLEEKNNNV